MNPFKSWATMVVLAAGILTLTACAGSDAETPNQHPPDAYNTYETTAPSVPEAPIPTTEPTQPPYEVSPHEIAPYVIQEIENFLGPFLSMFPSPSNWGRWNLETGAFDNAGNPIPDPIFIRYDAQQWYGRTSIAYRFNLFDLDGSGMPVIVVYFADETQGVSNWVNSSAVLYGFVDGAFKEIGATLPFLHFLVSAQGDIFAYAEDGHAYFYYFLQFSDGGMELVLISWDEEEDIYYNISHAIVINPLVELENIITANLLFGIRE